MGQSEEFGIKRVKYSIEYTLNTSPFNNNEQPDDLSSIYSSICDNNNPQYYEKIFHFHFSRRIQKYNTYSNTKEKGSEFKETDYMPNLYEELEKDDILEDNITNDYITYRKNDKKNIIIGKAENQKFLYFYALLLKRMEKEGDFDKFIQILNDNPNINELFIIFTILNEGLDYIHEQYIEENKELLKNYFLNILTI